MGLRYNTGYCICEHFNDGRFNSSMWVLPKFVLVYGFIMQVLYVLYIGIVGIVYHDICVVMGIPSHNIDFKGTMYVLHFGFLFNDECLENYKFFWCRNLSYFLQSWEGFQSPIPFMSKTPPSPFSQTKTWCGHLGYTMEGKIKWPFNLLMFHMLASQNSWKVNEGIRAPLWNGMFTKTFQAKRMSSNQLSKTTSGIHGKHLWH